jgi:uncharacterized protein
MKLHASLPNSLNTVTAYGPGFIEVNAQRHHESLIVQPEAPIEPWRVTRFDDLDEAAFDRLLALGPDVVLLGTGTRQRFPHPRLTARLAAARVGVEAMDSGAACRTYNILMAEGRKVVLAVLLPD